MISGAAACGLAAAQSDTWWHLRAGQDIWRTGEVSLVERYSYTAQGRYWPDHEWLWQVCAYALHDIGGMPLLALVNGLLAIGAVVLVGPRGKTRADVVLLLLAIPLLMGVWALRPQTTSLFLLALLLRLLRSERWWAIPPLMLLWANVHGAVATGGVVLVAACLAAGIIWIRERTETSRLRLRAVTLITALSALATLVTPLGVRLWSYIVDSIGRSKDNNIEEWQSAFHLNFFAVGFWIWLVLTAAVVLRQRRLVTDWGPTMGVAVAVVLAPFAVTAIRNITFFVLAALPLVAELCREHATRQNDDVPRGRTILRSVGALAAIGIAAIYLAPPLRLGWDPMSPAAVSAIRACRGSTYTTYYGGGYLIWFTPDVKVFVDNRQDPYPPEIIDLGVLGPGVDFQATFDRYDVQCAALAADDSSTREFLTSEGWRVGYDDGQWAVLGRPTGT